MSADLILVGGHVVTGDPERPTASAVAIRHGRIAAVGTDDEALAQRASGVEVVDLRGRTAVPAFNDAHCHPMGVGFAATEVDVGPGTVESVARIADRVRERAATLQPGEWVLASGYDDARLAERRHPTRRDLDAVAPENPVFVNRACHHIGVANSRALAAAGITASTPDPEGGRIDRDARGEPTGVLRESAKDLLQSALPAPTEDEIVAALSRAAGIYHSVGVTSVAEAGVRRPEELSAYQRVRDGGGPRLRAYLMVIISALLERFAETGIRTGFGDEWLRLGPAKLFLDGSVGARTSRMHEPYLASGEDPQNLGLWMQEPEAMRAGLLRAHALGWQVCAHAIGDAAVDFLLDCYAAARQAHPRPDTRHRIEHCEFLSGPQTLDRIAALGAVPVPGTTFIREFLPLYLQNLGEKRLRYANALRSFADRGIVAAASSDAPVVTVDPLAGIQTMLTRRDVAGTAASPEEAITFEAAVRAYTWAGAYASFEEGIKGSLIPGKVGDLAVLGADARTVEPDSISEIGVELTMMDGQVVHAS